MATITVTTLADQVQNDGQVSLREALEAANTDTTVDGATGSGADIIVFAVSGTLALVQGTLAVSSDVTIDGDVDGDNLANIAIDALGATRVFTITAGTATLDALFLTGGSAATGGGIRVSAGADVTIANTTVSGNDATFGGGLYNAGTVRLTNTTLSDNSAINVGGGMYNSGTATLTNTTLSGNSSSQLAGGIANTGTATLIDTTLSGNSADDGGGIFNAGTGALTLTDTTLTDNRADDNGGGIFSFGTMMLTNSTVSGNDATFGGGIYSGGPATLINTTLSGNAANIQGGGIYNSMTVTLTDSTLSGNRAGLLGGGIFDNGASTLRNSIVAGNAAGAAPDVLSSGSTIYSGVNVFSQAGAGDAEDIVEPDLANIFNQIAINPLGVLSGVLADNGGAVETIAIRQGGAAHDAGETAALPQDTQDLDGDSNTTEPLPVDARGQPRVTGAAVDVGAFEANVIGITRIGDGNDNLLVGTLGDDTIFGRGGNDRLVGARGSDVLKARAAWMPPTISTVRRWWSISRPARPTTAPASTR